MTTRNNIMKLLNIVLITILVITQLINGSLTCSKTTPNLTNRLPYEFKIVATGYYKYTINDKKKWDSKFIQLKKPVVMIDFTKANITFYDTIAVDTATERYVCPKIDKDGNGIPLSMSTVNYEKKVFNTILNTMQSYIEGKAPDKFFLGMVKKQKRFAGSGRYFELSRPKDTFISMLVQPDIEKLDCFNEKLRIVYADRDLNFQVREIDDKGCEVVFQKSINPDIDDFLNYPTIEEMIDYGYFLGFRSGKGYLSIKPNTSEYIHTGKKYKSEHYPKLINNKLFVHAQWLVEQMGGTVERDDNYSKRNIFKRTYEPLGFNDKEQLEIVLNDNEDVVTYNNVKYKLSAKPIFEKNYTMMPLRDLCELLKVRLIYQPISNTYLIQRFNSAYDPPFNLKKVE